MKSDLHHPYCIIKTIIDYSVTVFFLFLLIPVILVLTLAIKFTGRGPVIYSQIRIGKSGKPFKLYKFRSMHFGTEQGVPLLSCKKDLRISAIGRFMRKHLRKSLSINCWFISIQISSCIAFLPKSINRWWIL